MKTLSFEILKKSTPKTHLLSFGAPYESFKNAHKRFYVNARSFKSFDSISIFSEKTIYKFCKDFAKYKDKLSRTKGYGYWVWKYFLISELMNLVEENDIIIYADIGCTFNKIGYKRFKEYITKTQENGALTFELAHQEFKYTKKDTYVEVFGDLLENYFSPQRLAGIFFLTNNKYNKSIIEEINKIATLDDFHFVSDKKSRLKNHEEFIEHRHDQSLFSLICKKYDLPTLEDETYFKNFHKDGTKFPIWATRNKKKITEIERKKYFFYKYINPMKSYA
jgi:hypothetical protein